MTTRNGLWGLAGLAVLLGTAAAQQYPPPYPSTGPYSSQAAQPQAGAPYPSYPALAQQPLGTVLQEAPPSYPTPERLSGPPHPQAPDQPAPPFVLSPEEQAQLDQVLAGWEQYSTRVKTFEAKFTRWEYLGSFGNTQFRDEGEVKFAAPDKGLFQVSGNRPEKLICDGNSIFQYDYAKKEMTEHRLPPEQRGKPLADGPMHFLFGTTAEKLKARYFLRIITPQHAEGQVYLEARPKYQADEQDFAKAEVILDARTMQPIAVQTHEVNGKDRKVYQFYDAKVNAKDPMKVIDPLNIFERNPFKAELPPGGWTTVVQEPEPTETARQPAVRRY